MNVPFELPKLRLQLYYSYKCTLNDQYKVYYSRKHFQQYIIMIKTIQLYVPTPKYYLIRMYPTFQGAAKYR